jgi:hypothetical protein
MKGENMRFLKCWRSDAARYCLAKKWYFFKVQVKSGCELFDLFFPKRPWFSSFYGKKGGWNNLETNMRGRECRLFLARKQRGTTPFKSKSPEACAGGGDNHGQCKATSDQWIFWKHLRSASFLPVKRRSVIFMMT